MTRRLESVVRELQAADPTGRLEIVLLGELAGVSGTRDELLQVTAADPTLKSAALTFLEGLRAIRQAEVDADEDARFIPSHMESVLEP